MVKGTFSEPGTIRAGRAGPDRWRFDEPCPLEDDDAVASIDPALADRLTRFGQAHVLPFLERLDDAGRARLVSQLDAIDLEQLRALVTDHDAPTAGDATLAPPPVIHVGRDPDADRRARDAGEAELAAGRVAVLTVAGGQGTRLGFDGPKGAYPVAPVTGKTLFELFANEIAARRARHGAPLPWLIMTSDVNHDATVSFFEANDCFGLGRDSIAFFTQGMMPSVDAEGRVLLAAPDRLALNPNGHGGTLLALRDAGQLARLRADGITTLYYFQVDNPLARIADPAFIGHHVLARAEMSSKVVAKTDPDEKVGIIVERDGTLGVIEYSDLDPETARRRDDDGTLSFDAGNIAIHAFDVAFLDRVTDGGLQLPYHRANKKVPHLDADGRPVEPTEPNAIKFETFIFDALGLAARSATVMVDRAEEFSPVKNLTGVDSADTARAHMVDRAARWLEAAGHPVPRGADGRPAVAIEIDPRVALDADELRTHAPAPIDFSADVSLSERRS